MKVLRPYATTINLGLLPERQNRPGPPPATFATRDPLSRRRSRDNAVTQLIGVGYGVPGWTEKMTRRSLSGTMIGDRLAAKLRELTTPRVGFDYTLKLNRSSSDEHLRLNEQTIWTRELVEEKSQRLC
ncbi:hypothetical protein E4U32_000111 [Claviceps aff. humidiphila group G2b]|nr:hypothetical protein E4U32_000111 [Claviceps aff. humidiphila group G2b]